MYTNEDILNECQKAQLLVKLYEFSKENGELSENEDALSVRMIAEIINSITTTATAPQKPDALNDVTPSHSSFPQRLKHAMKAAGLTQKELAERAGVSQSVISRLITGKDKTGTRSGVLSHALGVNFDWLHYGTGEMYPANFSADNREV
ncbi:helix-turn-helix domain-containing protein [Morganella morganii]|uniref:helix-turn-helix domain-containing protein n=1 Tax=Morganella morganii TaxID=582 RepID=UPI0014199FCC|nr:helix-turn-helix transcriptional regulator [Morganella morganii]NIH18940.1 helix-turn-helix transcriptional regulator [Morganella morganii]